MKKKVGRNALRGDVAITKIGLKSREFLRKGFACAVLA
jgi:hypothetical protein